MEPVVTAHMVRPDVYDVHTVSRQRLWVEAGAQNRPDTAAGPGPMEMLAAGLGTCAADTINEVLTKMRFEVKGLRTAVEGRRAEKVPRIWTELKLTYLVRVEAPMDRVFRGAEIAERTCSAAAMLSKAADLTWSVVQVRSAEEVETLELRQRVLRPHQTVADLAAEDLEDPDPVWFVGVTPGGVVATAGVTSRPSPDTGNGWQIRQMAVSAEFRGSGLGKMLVEACVEHARAHGIGEVWAAARQNVEDFYSDLGFERTSDLFEIPGIGSHYRMSLTV